MWFTCKRGTKFPSQRRGLGEGNRYPVTVAETQALMHTAGGREGLSCTPPPGNRAAPPSPTRRPPPVPEPPSSAGDLLCGPPGPSPSLPPTSPNGQAPPLCPPTLTGPLPPAAPASPTPAVCFVSNRSSERADSEKGQARARDVVPEAGRSAAT